MPTSKQNLEGLKRWAQQATNDGLVDFVKTFDHDWELPGVDAWVRREMPSRAAIQAEVTTLSLAGLKRLREHFSERLEVIEAELKKRETRKGPPPKPDTWAVAILYYALINRKLNGEAKRLKARFDVSEKSLKRYRKNPHFDER